MQKSDTRGLISIATISSFRQAKRQTARYNLKVSDATHHQNNHAFFEMSSERVIAGATVIESPV
jgi:LAS superfamily LD-carboxypeptidase LdcB